MNDSVVNLLRRAVDLNEQGRSVIGCLLVKARGSTPQTAGALMLLDDASNIYGTIGGGCVEAELRQRAFAMLSGGETGLVQFKLDHDYGWDDGLICGGTIDLAIAPLPGVDELRQIVSDVEARRPTALKLKLDTDQGAASYLLRLPPRERLYIAGAGHVGQAVARQGLVLDFEVLMFDDRSDLLDRFTPKGATIVAGDIAGQLRTASIDAGTYCIIVTRGHKHDEQALAAVVGRGAKYVGMIGSRRKVKLVFDDLLDQGIDSDSLKDVRAPIGLSIGAVSVEEIALSIAAQLIEVRRAVRQSVIDGPIHEGRPNSNTAAATPQI